MTRLTKTTLAAWRAAKLEEQAGRCALCQEPIAAGEAVADHDHVTGAMRGVLHRGCNAMLGHIENNRARNKLTTVRRLSTWAANIVQYIHAHQHPATPRYPTHRDAEEKRELRNKRARKRRAATKES